jgi:uncharacterized protein
MSRFDSLLDEPGTSVAVIGATDDPRKYGGIAYRQLKAMGYRVFAVNPGRSDGRRRPGVSRPGVALPEAPTIVNFVVPGPHRREKSPTRRSSSATRNLWFQPGAESRRSELTRRLVDAGSRGASPTPASWSGPVGPDDLTGPGQYPEPFRAHQDPVGRSDHGAVSGVDPTEHLTHRRQAVGGVDSSAVPVSPALAARHVLWDRGGAVLASHRPRTSNPHPVPDRRRTDDRRPSSSACRAG